MKNALSAMKQAFWVVSKNARGPEGELGPIEEQVESAKTELEETRKALKELLEKIEEKKNELKKVAEESKVAKRELQEYKEKILRANDDLKAYSKAIYEAEYRIMDYAKRIDAKESAVFQEIQRNFEKYNHYNSEKTAQKDGILFESEFADLLVKNGFQEVKVTPPSKDYGADVIAKKDGVQYVFQCKYYTSAVGIEAIQQVYGAKIHYGAHVAVVATNSVFTLAAKTLAEESKVLLWDCETLDSMRSANQ